MCSCSWLGARLWSWFLTVDEDRSGQISATELQRALVNGNWSPFDLDTTKMLMGIFVCCSHYCVSIVLQTDARWIGRTWITVARSTSTSLQGCGNTLQTGKSKFPLHMTFILVSYMNMLVFSAISTQTTQAPSKGPNSPAHSANSDTTSPLN